MHTDCRSDDGVTVGLIDAVISICRILRNRDLMSDATVEALLDLRSDEDVRFLCQPPANSPSTPTRGDLRKNVDSPLGVDL